MKKQTMTIAGIPAILYGSRSRNVYLYLHGRNGCKEEAERFAATACEAGWQVLAIDLPGHGARKNSPEQLLPWVAVPEIEAVYARMKPVWAHIRLYGVSIGAWLAMQALQADAPEQALLVSPVVDMEALITNMMQAADVTEEQLQQAEREGRKHARPEAPAGAEQEDRQHRQRDRAALRQLKELDEAQHIRQSDHDGALAERAELEMRFGFHVSFLLNCDFVIWGSRI